MAYNREHHHRRSIRLQDRDYVRRGYYFLTLCTFQRECLFGEIVNGEMRLGEYGLIVREEWLKTPRVRANVVLNTFVIMPNHLHGILYLTGQRVGATRWVAPLAGQPASPAAHPGPSADSIGAIIGQFKSVTTRQVNALRGSPDVPLWHRNYFEHVIRDKSTLDAVRRYIHTNPLRWEADREHPRYWPVPTLP